METYSNVLPFPNKGQPLTFKDLPGLIKLSRYFIFHINFII